MVIFYPLPLTALFTLIGSSGLSGAPREPKSTYLCRATVSNPGTTDEGVEKRGCIEAEVKREGTIQPEKTSAERGRAPGD